MIMRFWKYLQGVAATKEDKDQEIIDALDNIDFEVRGRGTLAIKDKRHSKAVILSRLLELYSYAMEDKEQKNINLNSLSLFAEFIKKIHPLKPNLALTLKGSILARWKKDSNNFVVFEFEKDLIKYRLFHSVIGRQSGQLTIDHLKTSTHWDAICQFIY